MSKGFNPAPHDKRAEAPKKTMEADKKQTKLEKGFEDTFPTSDPVSELNPTRPKIDSTHLLVICAPYFAATFGGAFELAHN